MTSNPTDKVAKESPKNGQVHLVLQRYRHCRILLREEEWVSVGYRATESGEEEHEHCGLLVYISFAVGTTRDMVENAAQTIVNLSLLTSGLWGDGESEPKSLLDFISNAPSSSSVVLCPQANLISKIRGKSTLQYRGQCSKQEGEELFICFSAHVIGLLLEHQCKVRWLSLPAQYSAWKQAWAQQQQERSYREQQQQRTETQADPSIPPKDLFVTTRADINSVFDEKDGMPTLDAHGEALTKSAVKKLKKMRDAHAKRHEKWLSKQQEQSGGDKGESNNNAKLQQVSGEAKNKDPHELSTAELLNDNDDGSLPSWVEALDTCQVVVGSFGKRQGLEMYSDMGPFSHVLQL
mmetsp:Transcript_11187/g.14718  ORF Transcript_11187/g.14718 Transcript_11187/m.14718 type:complete len:350 (-) Transcript_11187:320-1369(-)